MRFQMCAVILTIMVLLPVHAHAQSQWGFAMLEPVSTGPEIDHLGRSAVAVDALGKVHMVFDRWAGLGDHDLYYSVKAGTGSWSTPEALGDHNALLASPYLAVEESSGTPYVLFLENDSLKLGLIRDAAWIYHDLETPGAGNLSSPTVAVDDFGRAHVAVINEEAGVYKIGYGLWDGPVSAQFHFQLLADSKLGDYGEGASPSLCIRSNGSVAISYRAGNYLNYRIDSAENATLGGLEWTIQSIDIPSHQGTASSMKCTPNDDLHLALEGHAGYGMPLKVFYARKDAGSTVWNSAEPAGGTLLGGDVKLSVEDTGAAHIIFQEISGHFLTGNVCFSSNRTGAWESEYLVTGDKTVPSFALDRHGNGSLVFEQYMSGENLDVYYYGFTAAPTLDCNTHALSAGTGGTVNFSLDAGFGHAGRNYLLLSGVSGTKPGVPLPGQVKTLALNWDLFTDMAMGLLNSFAFSDFLGSLNGVGKGAAQLNAPPLPPGSVGLKIFFAGVLNNPYDFASNPVSIEIVP